MKPLEGIKVVELSTMLAGPMTARILAEWGADIIKVETFNGDAWRKQGGTTMSPTTPDANPNFDMQNLNKRFVSLNQRTPAGHEAMMKLLENADVFLTNFREQALEGMGLSYEQLKDRFPRLIHAAVLGYGDKGPDKDRPGYDYTAFFSRSGLMADLPPAGAGPLVPIGGVGDHSVAVATDLGYFSQDVRDAITGADLVLLESNHDPDLLRQNPHYPQRLKTRILGKKGHLSNQSGAQAAVCLAKSGTRHLLLGHLSSENNTPDLAYRTTHAALTDAGAQVGADVTLHVAARYRASYLYTMA